TWLPNTSVEPLFSPLPEVVVYTFELTAITSSRFIVGAGTGNVPVPTENSETCSWSCPLQTVQNWWNSDREE
ncbi:MAG: hypothetical protein KDE46_16150, partial [Caldilineaceae bacterium]|nr:hypothetical protein [Caldilineaceae bacterium]